LADSFGVGKTFVYIGITLGGLLGSYVPVMIFHVSQLGLASIIGGAIGSVLGLWAGYKFYQHLDI